LEVACWAHFRRKIFENHQTIPTPLTTDLLERIAGLYRLEADVRRQHRQKTSRPMIKELRSVIDDALHRLWPKSAMAKALAYVRKRWDALTRFLDDGLAEIDNNIAERAMRSVAIGRKNWLGLGMMLRIRLARIMLGRTHAVELAARAAAVNMAA
jgi:transposase